MNPTPLFLCMLACAAGALRAYLIERGDAVGEQGLELVVGGRLGLGDHRQHHLQSRSQSMSNSINPLAMVATTGLSSSQSRSGKGASWFEVMADAWGKTLDAKASEIEAAGDALADGNDKPAHITHMTMLAQQMGFMSNSAHTSLQSVGTALETMARKQ